MLINRRRFLQAGTLAGVSTASLGAYACGIEPGLMLEQTDYALTPAGWPSGLPLRIAVIADIHACEPWMPVSRIRMVCERANAFQPDLTVILGDFHGGHNFVTAPVMPEQWGEALTVLQAPLGVYAILGNHDWWHGPIPRMRGDGAESVRRALAGAGVRLLENDAVRLTWQNQAFWLVGLGDQIAHRVARGVYRGADDLDGTLARVRDDAPILVLAHEPMIFHRMPKRVALTLCGHTHGGQIDLPIIGSPFADSRFGSRYVYGHVVDDDRHMIISAGLGTSIAPVRLGRPPELVTVTLGRPLLA